MTTDHLPSAVLLVPAEGAIRIARCLGLCTGLLSGLRKTGAIPEQGHITVDEALIEIEEVQKMLRRRLITIPED